MKNDNNDNNDELIKVAIIAKATQSETPFKTAFMATIGYYLAKSLVNVFGLSFFITLGYIIWKCIK